jgi:serine/threonine protein phosphatase PrpC
MTQSACASASGNRLWNADACLCDDSAGLYAVSDGHGDNDAAAETSARVIDLMREQFGPWLDRPVEQRTTAEAFERLVQGMILANLRTYDPGRRWRQERGERPTAAFTGAVAVGERVCVCHVGNTRLYHFAPATSTMTLATVDHTVMGELVHSGVDARKAAEDPRAHRILRAVGFGLWIEAELTKYRWRRDDVLVLCTSGLYRALGRKVIAEVLAEGGDLEAAAHRLVTLATARKDAKNATIVLVRHTGEQTSPTEHGIEPGIAEPSTMAHSIDASAPATRPAACGEEGA